MSNDFCRATFAEIVATDEVARRERAEREAIQAKREAFFTRASAVADDPPAWPQPQPLTVRVEPEPYPVDALPPAIRAAVEEVQCYVQAPLPMVACSAHAALSVAIQAHVDVQRDSRLSGPVSLFVVVIADSGERKTTCDSFFMRAIRDYEREQAEAANDPRATSDKCAGAMIDPDGGPYLPWGPYLAEDNVRRLRAELFAMVDELARAEGWTRERHAETLGRAANGPLSDLLPNIAYFHAKVIECRAEAEAQVAMAASGWRYDPAGR
ncbi:DUF3987 domain-containing protein [Paraburkholderia sp. B3]|uniref:DUF3987 domain-containing protein n=1 Tax=Paraburkholderia sp. B3 TaxID=3134791 RepID=UPI003981B033